MRRGREGGRESIKREKQIIDSKVIEPTKGKLQKKTKLFATKFGSFISQKFSLERIILPKLV